MSDAVTPDLHREVLLRDRMCFGTLAHIEQLRLARGLHTWMTPDIDPIPSHVCADRWGHEHPSTALDRLTVDHFHHHAGGTKGKRAKSDRAHLVAMCGWLNNRPPSRAVREAERLYIARLTERGRV